MTVPRKLAAFFHHICGPHGTRNDTGTPTRVDGGGTSHELPLQPLRKPARSKAEGGHSKRRNAKLEVTNTDDQAGSSFQAHLSSARTTVAARAPVAAPGRTVNVEKLTTADGRKQYTIAGRPLFDAYAVDRPKSRQSQAKREVDRGAQSVVYKRRNELAPIFVKTPRKPIDDVAARTRFLDDLANVLATTPDRDTAAHFAIEIHKQASDGTTKSLTRKVDGPTLADYFSQPKKWAAKLDVDTLPAKLDALEDAVTWLNAQGFEHRDIKADNIVIDLKDEGRLVLIDFGMARKHTRQQSLEHFKVRELQHAVLGEIAQVGDRFRALFKKHQGPS